MSQGIIAIIISLLAVWIAVRSFAKSKWVEVMFRELCEAIHEDIKEMEELEMTADEKIKKIEDIVKWTDEGLRFNELKGSEETEYKAHAFDSIRKIVKEQD